MARYVWKAKEMDYVCQLCNATCNGRLNFRRVHIMNSHVPEPKVFCPYCDFSETFYTAVVRRHVMAQHPDQEMAVIDRTADYEVSSLFPTFCACPTMLPQSAVHQ